ncbi:hypothetical protein Cgig2_010936 [Carnegiea gigantea]|uniref:Uncharacterized protein n=1 Tax=Carnegiea gigantea TaxID=171969 RepID=A0A9Q1JN40_9CARY|nr:hypothetical protein Cgig2_010936 [Carnegiea gigantea]
MEDINTAKPTKSMTHSATNMPETIGITFKISRETANRRSLSLLKLSKMIVSVHNTESPSLEVSPMLKDEQVIGEHTINVPQFTTELQDGQLKRKHSRAKKPRPRKPRSTVSYRLHLATLDTRNDLKNHDPNAQTSKKEGFIIKDASNYEETTLSRRHLFPRCTHALEPIDGAPKIIEGLIKLRVDEAISPVMKKLDKFLACQRMTNKVAYRRLFVKGRFGTTKT